MIVDQSYVVPPFSSDEQLYTLMAQCLNFTVTASIDDGLGYDVFVDGEQSGATLFYDSAPFEIVLAHESVDWPSLSYVFIVDNSLLYIAAVIT